MATIAAEHIVESVRAALQFIAVYHTPDYLSHLVSAWRREASPAARNAMGQILASSRMAALGRRPVCQDTGMVTVFARLGQGARIAGPRTLEALVNEATRLAYLDAGNPLRASMVADPLFDRKNTGDNTPAVTHVELTEGASLELLIAAKGFGSENKSRFAVLNPADDVADWAVETVESLGAGWCPPGIVALGIGGSAEKAMLLAKRAALGRIDMAEILDRGPRDRIEELRVALYERINALGIGAQGLGGLATVLDVKIATYPTHAASKPVALIPQCAANRHATVTLDGSGPAYLKPPSLDAWPPDALAGEAAEPRRVRLDTLDTGAMRRWRAGETLLLSGTLLTGRDAAHKRIADLVAEGAPLPVDLAGRVIYYTGPVDAVAGEVVGPAGPTTATRMDGFTETMLDQGLLAMIGKAERGPAAIAAIARHGAVYLVAVGGAAVLISRAIRAARVVAFEDLGMEAIREFEVTDMPVIVGVDAQGTSIHATGPAAWRRPVPTPA